MLTRTLTQSKITVFRPSLVIKKPQPPTSSVNAARKPVTYDDKKPFIYRFKATLVYNGVLLPWSRRLLLYDKCRTERKPEMRKIKNFETF